MNYRAIMLGKTEAELAPVRTPTEMSESLGDIDSQSTTRTASGKMVRSVVRGGANTVRTISLKWQNAPARDIAKILTIVGGTYFYMRYPDMLTGDMRTAQFYAGDRKADIKSYKDGNLVFGSLEFNAIER